MASSICVNTTEMKDGYCLQYAGGGSPFSIFLEYLSGILMIGSFIVATGTIVLSFNLNKQKKFVNWRRIERFVVYEATTDMVYYVIHICYITHITVIGQHYPDRTYCMMYAFLFNVFGLSQTLMTVAVSVSTFSLIYYNRSLTLGTRDCILHSVIFTVPIFIFSIVGALGQLGPNGLYCNFDGIRGRLSHLIITSIGNTIFIIFTAALYALICRKIFEESKRLGVTLHKSSTTERRALSAAKNSSLLILAFFVQFGVFILDGIWFAVAIPPPEVHHFIVLVGSSGGIVNGIIFHIIRKREHKVSPRQLHRVKSRRKNTEIINISSID